MTLTLFLSKTVRSMAVAALLFSGLACAVTPEPIPAGQDAGVGFDGIPWQGDMGSSADAIIALDMMSPPDVMPPPGGDGPEGDAQPTPVDGTLDAPRADGAPAEGGLEGGPPEAGPLEVGPAADLTQD